VNLEVGGPPRRWSGWWGRCFGIR